MAADHSTVWMRHEVNGRRYWSFKITETDIDGTYTYDLDALPVFFTITLFECELTSAGSATTVNPLITHAEADGPVETIAENELPAASLRNQCDVRVTSRTGKLTIQTRPDVTSPSVASEVVTQITIAEGH